MLSTWECYVVDFLTKSFDILIQFSANKDSNSSESSASGSSVVLANTFSVKSAKILNTLKEKKLNITKSPIYWVMVALRRPFSSCSITA